MYPYGWDLDKCFARLTGILKYSGIDFCRQGSTLPAKKFEYAEEVFFPSAVFDKITDARVDDPSLIEKSAGRRKRRERLTKDGRLAILAADHPARMVTKSGKNQTLMGNRRSYLGRVLRVATNPQFDGVMGTTDVIEDLLIVDELSIENGAGSFLDGKLLLGCMNRGGLNGAEFEMDDRFTSFTAESIRRLRLDGAKMMVRLDLKDSRSLDTLVSCAEAINELNRNDIPIFLEIFSVERTPEGYKANKSADELIKTIGVATALGDSSRGIWLKIPYCDGFDRVAKSTTCPILMLGGESVGNLTGLFREFSDGMAAGRNVRGALVGRNVLYPGQDDPSAVAEAVSKIVHERVMDKQALTYIESARGLNMNRLTSGIA